MVVSLTMFANMISAEDDAARVLAGALEGVTDEAGPDVKVDWRPVANGCWRITWKTFIKKCRTVVLVQAIRCPGQVDQRGNHVGNFGIGSHAKIVVVVAVDDVRVGIESVWVC